MSAIEIKQLSFNYIKDTPVLVDIDLLIQTNTITAILGKNGCGKSTLLDCIIGYNQIKNGQIIINDKDVKSLSEKQIAKEIAYIPQSTVSNMDFTVQEFILFGRNCHLKFGETLKAKDYEIVYYNAELLKIDNILSKNINKISGGERQLAFVARALTQESPIIIMDEPTANLDFGNQAILYDIIRDLQSKGKTVLFTTHNPNHVMELGCEVIGMRNGSILCHGKSDEILTEDLIKNLYGDFNVEFDGKTFTIKTKKE